MKLTIIAMALLLGTCTAEREEHAASGSHESAAEVHVTETTDALESAEVAETEAASTESVARESELALEAQQVSRDAIADLSARLVAYWPLASMSAEKDPNHFGFGIGNDAGAVDFVQRHFVNAYRLGYRRVCVHLPLGKQSTVDGHMGVDAPDDLAETGREAIVSDWIAALRWMNRHHADMEIIVYLGSHDRDSDNALEQGRYWEHFDRMWRGIKPFLDMPNVSIVFDNAVAWPEDHPYARIVQTARWYKERQGRTVGVEASPQRALPWTRDYTVWIIEGVWHRQRHNGNFSRRELTGEILSVLDGYPTTKTRVEKQMRGDWFAAAADIYRDDRTPVIQIWGGDFKDMSAGQLATEILRRSR